MYLDTGCRMTENDRNPRQGISSCQGLSIAMKLFLWCGWPVAFVVKRSSSVQKCGSVHDHLCLLSRNWTLQFLLLRSILPCALVRVISFAIVWQTLLPADFDKCTNKIVRLLFCFLVSFSAEESWCSVFIMGAMVDKDSIPFSSYCWSDKIVIFFSDLGSQPNIVYRIFFNDLGSQPNIVYRQRNTRNQNESNHPMNMGCSSHPFCLLLGARMHNSQCHRSGNQKARIWFWFAKTPIFCFLAWEYLIVIV